MDNRQEIELLMDIQNRLGKVEANTSRINETTEKVEKAYQLSRNNEKEIAELQNNAKWWNRTAWTALILPIALFFIENFFMK